MLRVGVIVNPVAGVGGPAALKGSDGAANAFVLARQFDEPRRVPLPPGRAHVEYAQRSPVVDVPVLV